MGTSGPVSDSPLDPRRSDERACRHPHHPRLRLCLERVNRKLKRRLRGRYPARLTFPSLPPWLSTREGSATIDDPCVRARGSKRCRPICIHKSGRRMRRKSPAQLLGLVGAIVVSTFPPRFLRKTRSQSADIGQMYGEQKRDKENLKGKRSGPPSAGPEGYSAERAFHNPFTYYLNIHHPQGSKYSFQPTEQLTGDDSAH